MTPSTEYLKRYHTRGIAIFMYPIGTWSDDGARRADIENDISVCGTVNTNTVGTVQSSWCYPQIHDIEK